MFPVVIRGDTVELREMEPRDAVAVADIIADEAVLRYTTWKGATDLGAAESFVRTALATAGATPRVEYLLTIVYPATGQLIGSIGIRHEDEEGAVGSLRFLLRRDWWGRGVATEAAKLTIQFGFETLGLRSIEADPAVENAASLRVLEKVGMRRLEFRPHNHVAPDGVLRDSVRFAISGDDYPH
jgi:[ribosomal protein S5]-alanine N-acetyltransferase